MDLSYKDYTERQRREVEADRLQERALTLRPSGNYRRNGVGWVPQSYPGFAVISMVHENEGNNGLSAMLKAVQADLLEQCPWEESIYLLPSDSFHQTVANNLSEERFLQRIQRPGLEAVYPELVNRAFTRLPSLPRRVLPMRLIGVGIFGTALGALGIFDDEEAYNRILDFRSGFYADPSLGELDVRMTRPFIGHITLAYIESELDTLQRSALAGALSDINRRWPASSRPTDRSDINALRRFANFSQSESSAHIGQTQPSFNLSLTGLRRYHHLSAFHREEDYPRYHL
jgi:hypothetical protein